MRRGMLMSWVAVVVAGVACASVVTGVPSRVVAAGPAEEPRPPVRTAQPGAGSDAAPEKGADTAADKSAGTAAGARPRSDGGPSPVRPERPAGEDRIAPPDDARNVVAERVAPGLPGGAGVPGAEAPGFAAPGDGGSRSRLVPAVVTEPVPPPVPAAAGGTPAYPSPAWKGALAKLDAGLLARQSCPGRGRFRPVDTAARELLRSVFLEGSMREAFQYVDADGRKVIEPPAVTLFGIVCSPQHYYDAPLFCVVSKPLRLQLLGHHWERIESRIDTAGPEEAAKLRAERTLLRRKLHDPFFVFLSYRELVAELLWHHKAATADSLRKAATAGGPDATLRARLRTEAELTELASRLDTLDSTQKGRLRTALFAEFRARLEAAGPMASDTKDGAHLKHHIDDLAKRLESFDAAGRQLLLMPTSLDADAQWAPPEYLPFLIRETMERRGPMQAAASAPERATLPEGKLVLPEALHELDEEGVRKFVAKWAELKAAFVAADGEAINARAGELFSAVRGENPDLVISLAGRPLYHPSDARLSAEVFYNSAGRLNWGWMVFFAAMVVLAAALAMRSRGILVAGGLLYVASLAIITAAFGFRLVLAQRGSAFGIPISSQFESMLWASFFGCWVATGVAAWMRTWASVACLIGVSALGALTLGMSWLMPMGVGTDITPETPVLRSALLPFHVGTMVGGYALIAICALVGALYLVCWFAAGGSAEEKIGLVQLDRFHNYLLQGTFLLLLVGLILGAMWGDVAWGRWWGWDPKETWAFITWMVYTLIVHVRLIVKDRGPITACLSVWGFTVMFFTWFGTNYGLTRGELHAYSGVDANSVDNLVPIIWIVLTVLVPFTGGVFPGGPALAARAVFLARTEPDAPAGRNLATAAIAMWAFLGLAGVLLHLKVGTTLDGAWRYFWPTPETPVDAGTFLPGMGLDDANRWAGGLMLGFWLVLTAALSCTIGWVITKLADKTPSWRKG